MEFISIISTALSVIGALSAGQSRARQYEAAAAASQYNAAVARQRAENARAVYGQREEMQRRRARMILGQQRAAIAESGTGLGGSNLDIERQSEVMAELDALNIAYEGELVARGALSEAAMYDFESSSYREQASSARRSGYIGAGAALLSGIGDYIRVSETKAPQPRPKVYGLYGSYPTYG